MAAEPVKVEGLDSFRKSLKVLDRDLPKALRLAFNEAADVVVSEATRKIPRRSGRAQRSVKAKSTQSAARISGGGNKAPYYPWLDFGGRVGRNKSIIRPFKKEGRYIYDAYHRKSASGEFAAVLERTLTNVARSAGVEVD